MTGALRNGLAFAIAAAIATGAPGCDSSVDRAQPSGAAAAERQEEAVLKEIEPLLDPSKLVDGAVNLDSVRAKKARLEDAKKRLKPFSGAGVSDAVEAANQQLDSLLRTIASVENVLTGVTAEAVEAKDYVQADDLFGHALTSLGTDSTMIAGMDEAFTDIDVPELTKRITRKRERIAQKVGKARKASAREDAAAAKVSANGDAAEEGEGCTAAREQVAVEIAAALWRDPTISEAKGDAIVRRVGKRHGLSAAQADAAHGLCLMSPRVIAAGNSARR